MQDTGLFFGIGMVKNEFLHKGKKIPYDACHTGTLNDAKEFYKDSFEYIGTSKILYHNGVKNVYKTDYHCFIRKKKLPLSLL